MMTTFWWWLSKEALRKTEYEIFSNIRIIMDIFLRNFGFKKHVYIYTGMCLVALNVLDSYTEALWNVSEDVLQLIKGGNLDCTSAIQIASFLDIFCESYGGLLVLFWSMHFIMEQFFVDNSQRGFPSAIFWGVFVHLSSLVLDRCCAQASVSCNIFMVSKFKA